MSVKMRQLVEKEIVECVVDDALKAGYLLAVYSGEETTERSRRRGIVLKAMMKTDEDYLLFSRAEDLDDARVHGWVRFIYGNDGWDVVSDYTVNLEPVMAGAHAIANKYN